jgi:17beta-estradiol 17-dehydrogenase / very-long-chain 3-oxoacyl-CoA reductase
MMGSSLTERISALASMALDNLTTRISNITRPSLSDISSIIGYTTLAYTLYKVSSTLAFNLHSSKIQRYNHPSRTNPANKQAWALVTGASSGIGLEFAHALASSGFNVILHGRNSKKFAPLISALEKKYPNRKFKTLILDSQTPATDGNFDHIVRESVDGLNLTTVIHNVGGIPPGYKEMEWHTNLTIEEIDGWIDINCRFAAHLTRILLPDLISNQPGLMMYISSGVTVLPVPKITMYTAAKGFIELYARNMRMEMKLAGHDVEFKALVTGTVATVTSGRTEKDRSAVMPLTGEFVGACLDKVGWDEAVITPWWGHQVQGFVGKLLPMWVFERVVKGKVEEVEREFQFARDSGMREVPVGGYKFKQ